MANWGRFIAQFGEPGFQFWWTAGFAAAWMSLKALAIGARAVGIGRPYLYGLAAFGQEGVERVLDLLCAELALAMRQCGTTSIAQITRASVLRNGLRF